MVYINSTHLDGCVYIAIRYVPGWNSILYKIQYVSYNFIRFQTLLLPLVRFHSIEIRVLYQPESLTTLDFDGKNVFVVSVGDRWDWILNLGEIDRETFLYFCLM